MPPEVKTFKDLVAWLVQEHHRGVWLDMARKLNVSSGLIYQWRDGLVKRPTDEYIDRICAAYRLDYWKVLGIITGRKPPSAAAWLLPLVFAFGCSLWPSAQANAQIQPVGMFSGGHYALRLIGIWRRYWRRTVVAHARRCTFPLHGMQAAC